MPWEKIHCTVSTQSFWARRPNERLSSTLAPVLVKSLTTNREKPDSQGSAEEWKMLMECWQLSDNSGVGQSLSDKASYEETIGILPDLPARVRQTLPLPPNPTCCVLQKHRLCFAQALTKATTGHWSNNFKRQTWHHQGNNTNTVTICETQEAWVNDNWLI